jgi:hypothetical protein
MEGIFVVLAVVLLWFFSRSGQADEPVLTKSEPQPEGFRAFSALLFVGLLGIATLAVFGAGELDTPTMGRVRAGGGDDAVVLAGALICIGLAGGILWLEGCAPKLGLAIFLFGVLASVFFMGAVAP